MPHVTVSYKMYLPAGHHRQPRSVSVELDLSPSSEVEVNDGTSFKPSYFDQLPYSSSGTTGLAQLIFWAVSDGSAGHVYSPDPLTQTVNSKPMTITAWYYPIAGGGGGGSGPTTILDDAFSARLNRFVDDTFVTVTSTPALTQEANVGGDMVTTSAQTMVAAPTIASTSEPFGLWFAGGAGTAQGDTLNVNAGATGLVVAVYQAISLISVPRFNPGIVGTIYGGVAVDGNGGIIINGVPHPIDPWGPILVQLIQGAIVAIESAGFDKSAATEVRRLAAQQAVHVMEKGIKTFKKDFGG